MEGGRGVEKQKNDPRLQAMYYIQYRLYFLNSRSLGIPADLISRNNWGSLGIPGNLISGDLRGSLGIFVSGHLQASLGISKDLCLRNDLCHYKS